MKWTRLEVEALELVVETGFSEVILLPQKDAAGLLWLQTKLERLLFVTFLTGTKPRNVCRRS